MQGTENRREFLSRSVSAIAIPTVISASALGLGAAVAPSERITIGMIGIGRQARAYNLPWFLRSKETEVVAVCDVDSWRLKNAAEMVRQSGGAAMSHADFRMLLDDSSIDAVMVSTPDHSHVPISIAALRKGKDVCCEKPITKSIAEGRRLVEEVASNRRVFRVDSEARFKTSFCKAAEVVRNGRIGTLVSIEVGVPTDNASCGQPETMAVPDELDYDTWLGPGYGLLTDEITEAMHLAARTEGLILDPVYTGKVMAGLIGMIRRGDFKKTDKVLFIHTGGSTALFGYEALNKTITN